MNKEIKELLVEVENVNFSNYRWRLTEEEIDRKLEEHKEERRPIAVYRGEKEMLVVWSE